MRDERFEQFLAAWRKAEQAFEDYTCECHACVDPAVRRLMTQQFQNVAWRRYGVLCRYLASCRTRLPRL